ncbi:deoxypodophyllotoxin synthase-like [Diospyros lotus]|uniref:deoxypodophyllotoxin synthase-like n=1 Tax=Diospyros lotus TaxID=55363 RepID=UPI00224FD5F1|nr:deoxypodophyllotoxin synthase-like [Diospyros lotus]
MASKVQPKLPIIDFSKENLKPGSSNWLSTAQEVQRALEEYGAFAIKAYDKMPSELHDAMFELAKGLFDLPEEIKAKNTSAIKGFGHDGNFKTMLVEYFGIHDGGTPQGIQRFTNLMWPAGNHAFAETTLLYARKLSEIGKIAVLMAFESYGAEKYYNAHLESVEFLMRFLKYPRPSNDHVKTGLHYHVDKGFWAILDQNQVKGLQIETKNGEWLTFEPSPSTFVFVAGEAFVAWSNGRIHPCLHRVMADENATKYSIGLFAFANGIVEVPQELVDDERPLRFKPFDHYSFLHYCLDEGRNLTNAINTYCGV